jgi:carbamoyltransferase
VTHVDGSSRIQTVGAEANSSYRRLLGRFHARFGCPVVINTSFNVRGEPIVCTPEDAYRCFMNTDMDALILGNVLIEKAPGPRTAEGAGWRGTFEPD